MKFFTTFIFSKIDLFLAQSKETINRLNILGATNTKLLGNMKINPEKKTPKRPRNPEMPDDSVSDITDLEKQEVLAKYY